TSQKGLKGNIIIFPQELSSIARVLPPSLEELKEPICVIFIGSMTPTREWLLSKASPLIVRPLKVHATLEWMKSNNKLYADMDRDYLLLNSLPEQSHLPVYLHFQINSQAS
ncbi:hypothetical protein BJ165DRAFT_1339847, partial [Panaeolus papilionaceus]